MHSMNVCVVKMKSDARMFGYLSSSLFRSSWSFCFWFFAMGVLRGWVYIGLLLSIPGNNVYTFTTAHPALRTGEVYTKAVLAEFSWGQHRNFLSSAQCTH